jgi:hypothetical protein
MDFRLRPSFIIALSFTSALVLFLLQNATPSVLAQTPTDPVLVGAGDIASCATAGDEATALLLDGLPDATVFTAGDNAYDSGTASEFSNCYDPSWGRHKSRTHPAVGNQGVAKLG